VSDWQADSTEAWMMRRKTGLRTYWKQLRRKSREAD
jgi:hypothetical protein